MKEDLQYLRERVDTIGETLTRNTVILEQNTKSLEEHMRQTIAIEKRVTYMEEKRKFTKWLVYIMGLLGTASGAIISLKQLLGK